MKLSSNSVGMLIFFALATTIFVLMVLRPAVDGNAMYLGIPLSSETTAVTENTEAAATTESSAESSSETIESETSAAPESTEIDATEEAKPSDEEPAPDAATEEKTTTN